MAISTLELRHIIESAFLPMRCKSSVNAEGELSIEIIDPVTGANSVMGAIPVAQLNTSRAISELIAQLRAQMLPQPVHRLGKSRSRSM